MAAIRGTLISGLLHPKQRNTALCIISFDPHKNPLGRYHYAHLEVRHLHLRLSNCTELDSNRCRVFFFIEVKTCNIKFTHLIILKYRYSCVSYLHFVKRHTSGTFSSCKTETLHPLYNSSFPPLPTPDNCHSTF